MRELAKPELLSPRGGAWFALADGRELHIGVEAEFVPARKAHPALLAGAAALDLLAERLAAAGAPVRWDEELPVRRFYTEDPWGNRLEVLASRAEEG